MLDTAVPVSARGIPSGRLGLRHRLGLVLVVFVAFFAVFAAGPAAPGAQALVPAAVPILPVLAETGLLVGGVAVVGLGAWYAWSNRDTIASWWNRISGFGMGRNTNGGVYAWKTTPAETFDVAHNRDTWSFVNVSGSTLGTGLYVYNRCYNPSTHVITDWQAGRVTDSAGAWVNASTTSKLNESRLAGSNCPDPAVTVDLEVTASANYRGVDNGGLYWHVDSPNVSPNVDTRVTVTCRDALGNSATYSGPITTAPLSADAPSTATVPSCAAILPNSHQETVQVQQKPSSSSTWTTVINHGMSSSTTDPYADCLASSGSTPCDLSVWLNAQQCSTTITACADWWGASATSSAYTCHWGSHVIPLGNCQPLRWQYDPAAGPATETDPGLATQPATTAPGTGTGTGTGTQPAPMPTSGTNLDPSTGTSSGSTTGPAPDALDTSSGSCLGGVWSWNPVDWVFVPVKCALRWAFLPDPVAVQADLDTLGHAWDGSAIHTVTDTFNGSVSALGGLGGGGGCDGPAVTVTFPLTGQSQTMHPISACAAPMSTVAFITKTIFTLGMFLGCVIVITRIVAAAFGFPMPAWDIIGGRW